MWTQEQHLLRAKNVLRSTRTFWLWVAVALATISVISALMIDPNTYPASYLRYLSASLLILYLPGYVLLRFLFPRNELGDVERVVLNIIASMTIVAILASILNFTAWGIRLLPMTLALLAFVLFFAILTVGRHYLEGSKSAH